MAFYQPDNKRSNDNTIMTSPPEKGVVEVYEHQGSYDEIDNGPTYDDAQTSRLLRKMDFNIVPFLALLYLWVFICLPFMLLICSLCRLSFLDRTNIGNARLVGLEKDLKMKGLDYNVTVHSRPHCTCLMFF